MSSTSKEYPNVRHLNEYTVWCLDEVHDDILWEIVQTFGDRGTRHLENFEGEEYYDFTLNNGEMGFSSFANVKSEPMVMDNDEVEIFIQHWGALPKTCFLIENNSKDTGAYLSVEFVKAFQRRYPNTAFEYGRGPEGMAFDDDIQKANFIPNSTPIPNELEESYNQERRDL